MIFAILIIFTYLFYYLCNYYYKPKFIKKKEIYDNTSFNLLDKNRFSIRKIPNNIDIIIIGSGISGLTSASLLSKSGKKVLVIEQHYIAGGNLHTFEDNNIEHDTGLHYIGLSKTLKGILDLLTPNLSWYKLGTKNNDIYDMIIFGKDKYGFRKGKDNIINDLSIIFPDERDNLITYFNLIEKVASNNYFKYKIISNKYIYHYLMKLIYYFDSEYIKYLNLTTYQVISSITRNKKLIDVLCGQCGDYGIKPTESNFFIHANVVNHYLDGGYYPNGGTSTISKELIRTINKNNGTVLVGKKVKKLLIKNNECYGLQMENNINIYCKKIISSIGYKNTFVNLMGNKSVQDIKSSKSFITLFVNFKNSVEELDIPDYNIWYYPYYNIESSVNNLNDDLNSKDIPFFLSSSSAKDNTWNERYPNKSNVSIICLIDNNKFESWREEKCGNRSIEYKNVKEELSKNILENCLFKLLPKTRNNVVSYNLATSETYRYYLNTFDGEGYGLESSKKRFLDETLVPKTNIKNLYLTGQDICTMGISGALFSGVLTSYSILEYGNLIDLIMKKDLIKDLK